MKFSEERTHTIPPKRKAHYCNLPRGHPGDHHCLCGVTWCNEREVAETKRKEAQERLRRAQVCRLLGQTIREEYRYVLKVLSQRERTAVGPELDLLIELRKKFLARRDEQVAGLT